MSPRGTPDRPPLAGDRVELAATACRADRICARRPGGHRTLWVRPATSTGLPVAAELFELEVRESWLAGATRWLTGNLSRVRLDVPALELEPLALWEVGPWDASRDQMTDSLVETGRRSEYEMERILPAGRGNRDAEETLLEALALWGDGERAAAEAALGDLQRGDLRCLEAHSCLGYLAFNRPGERGDVDRARRHYEAGLRIGELSLGRGFDGVLPWSRLGNRPFLRCLYGYAVCLWRLGDLDGARADFRRLCRLSPADQLAARLALDRIGAATDRSRTRPDPPSPTSAGAAATDC